jgi:16S rRNA (cytosine967-C5)-methyltransferase
MIDPEPTDRLENRLRNRCALLDGLIRTLDADSLRGHPADSGLARFFQAHRECGSRDRRLLSEAVFAWFRWRGALIPHLQPDAAGALQGLVLDGQRELCSDLLAHHLPRLSADRAPRSTDLDQRLLEFAAWTGSPTINPNALLPAWVPAALRIPPHTPASDFQRRLLVAFQSRPPTWVRFRPTPPAPALARFLAACPEVTPHPFRADALRLPARFNLRARPEWERNLIVQDLASQTVAAICQPRPGDSWWDACSGGGGKALHLADLMGDSGTLLATDIRASALAENKRRAHKAGLRSIRHQIWDGKRDPAPRLLFDGVLLDVPCSGLGTWARNPDARWRLDPARIAELAELQFNLLETAAPKVKPGGVLVYATCTLTDAENEKQIDRFLASHPDFAPDPMTHPLTGQPCPTGRLWIYPWDGPDCTGLFMARLNRSHELESAPPFG